MPRLQFSVNSCYIVSTSSTLTCFQLFLAWLCHAQTTTQYVMFVEKMCIENEYRFKKKKAKKRKEIKIKGEQHELMEKHDIQL